MDIIKPLYTDKNGFNVNWFKYTNNSYLTLSEAFSYFVSLTGINLMKGFYYFYNSTIFYGDCLMQYLNVNNSVACDKLTTDSIMCNNLRVNNLICNNLQTLKFTLYYSNYSIPIYNDLIFSQLGKSINLTNTTILLQPKTKLIFKNSENIIKIVKNTNNNPYFYDINFEAQSVSIKEIT